MAGRDDLVYDEDDYVPPGYVPPKRAGNRTKHFVVVAIVGVLVGAVLLMYVMRSRERTRFVQIESDRAGRTRSSPRTRWPEVAQPIRTENWSRIIGVWSRVPDPEREISYPIRFEFRPDETAVVTRPDHEGMTTTREWQARVLLETSGSITLETP